MNMIKTSLFLFLSYTLNESRGRILKHNKSSKKCGKKCVNLTEIPSTTNPSDAPSATITFEPSNTKLLQRKSVDRGKISPYYWWICGKNYTDAQEKCSSLPICTDILDKNETCFQRCDVLSGNDPSICEEPLQCIPRVSGCFYTPFNRNGRCAASNKPIDCGRSCVFGWDCDFYETCIDDHICVDSSDNSSLY